MRAGPPGGSTCGCASRSSATSSIVTMRSSARDERRQRAERRRLARAGAAAHEDVAARADRVAQQVAQRRAPRPELDQVVGAEHAAAEPPDRQRRAVQRQRRDHDVDARAVGQPRVAQRLGLVDAAPERREDPLDRVQQLGLVGERDRRRLEPAARARPRPAACPQTMTSSTSGSASSGSSGPRPNDALRDAAGELLAAVPRRGSPARSSTSARICALDVALLGRPRRRARQARRAGLRRGPRDRQLDAMPALGRHGA